MKNISMIFAVAALLCVSLIVPFSSAKAAYELLGRRTTNTYSSYYDAFMTSNVQSTGGWLGSNNRAEIYLVSSYSGDSFVLYD